ILHSDTKETMTSVIGDAKTLFFLPSALRPRENGQWSSHEPGALPPTPVKCQSTFRSIRKPISQAPPFGTKTNPISEPSDELIKSDRAALLDHEQCKQARPKSKELLQMYNMDSQQDAIDHILKGVESIQNLKSDTVEALRNAIVGRMVIDKFKVCDK
ncbi:hypothetical protein T310_10111, partial [Rasamsonia emersonii CBS 393.64]